MSVVEKQSNMGGLDSQTKKRVTSCFLKIAGIAFVIQQRIALVELLKAFTSAKALKSVWVATWGQDAVTKSTQHTVTRDGKPVHFTVDSYETVRQKRYYVQALTMVAEAKNLTLAALAGLARNTEFAKLAKLFGKFSKLSQAQQDEQRETLVNGVYECLTTIGNSRDAADYYQDLGVQMGLFNEPAQQSAFDKALKAVKKLDKSERAKLMAALVELDTAQSEASDIVETIAQATGTEG